MSSPTPPALLSIVALARAGAVAEAWRRLEVAGFGADDPAALTVRGSLLKRLAVAAPTDAGRRGLWRQAADAYGRAAELQRTATYPFINAASLSLLAGDAEGSRARASQVLGLIERGEDGPETPYWRAATRAEALLLLGRSDEARAGLTEAVGLAPRAWEDHASTLRQFALVLGERGEDAGWLDPLRPPRALHFAGHMAVAGDDVALAAAVRDFLERERIGFGYGALGAGADIVIAEALLERDAELHLVLPAEATAFAAQSVTPFGDGWQARYDAVLARADTVEVSTSAGGAAARQVAAEAAMGAAVMQADLLQTQALQLVVLESADAALDAGRPGGSAWMARAWRDAGRRQSVLAAPRVGAKAPELTDDDGFRAVVLAQARMGHEALAGLAGSLAGVAMVAAPRWTGEGFELAFATPDAAARGLAALRMAGGEGFSAGAWYGPMASATDPFGGAALLVGEGQAMVARITASAPPGTVLVNGPLAQALAASPGGGPGTEHVGDLAGEAVRLFALH